MRLVRVLKKIAHVGEKAGEIAIEDGLPIASVFFPFLGPVATLATLLEKKSKNGGNDQMKGMGGWLIKMLSLIPYVVSGIEQIHGEAKTGAEKKQLAMEALGLAATSALTLDPGQSQAIQAAAALASDAIDGVKSVYNAVKAAPAAPAAAPAVAVAPAAGFSAPSSL